MGAEVVSSSEVAAPAVALLFGSIASPALSLWTMIMTRTTFVRPDSVLKVGFPLFTLLSLVLGSH